jgi:serine/tyrosine/threonine adenylyltransferase
MSTKIDQTEMGWNLDNSYSNLPASLYTQLKPTPVPSPRMVLFNHTLAESLGLNTEGLNGDAGAAIFSGNQLPPGADPLAQAYAGHQFGHFTILGDGRALLLGEQVTPSGIRLDLQFKGSGRTPYSRGGDGRAALGPMLREYLISEAMHHLAIPTTRSLAVVTTGLDVLRETRLQGAVLTRVATSHIRVGTFQYAAQRGVLAELQSLADYTLQRHFPGIQSDDERYPELLQEVIKRQAALIAKWQLAGFIHGVMNTDNMALSGETIDYGPCAFMDAYHPQTVFSSIDYYGRYAYANQPSIAGWNLTRLAETLLPLLHPEKPKALKLAQDTLAGFPLLYHYNWLKGMRRKLGLFNDEDEDETMINELLSLMEEYRMDYTNTFRSLTLDPEQETPLSETNAYRQWMKQWQARRARQPHSGAETKQLMRQSNPAVIPRNHQVEAALDAAVNRQDLSAFHQLLAVLENPYAYTPEQEAYAAPPPLSDVPYRTFCGT